MALLLDSTLSEILATTIIFCLLYWWYKNSYTYWDKKGVVNDKRSLLVELLIKKRPIVKILEKYYSDYNGERFVGFFLFNKPALLIRDPKIIHRILVKDFTYFYDRGQPEAKHDPTYPSLFNLRGQVWRALRYKLTPTFSTGKLKRMFEPITKCGDNMIKNVQARLTESSVIETKSLVFDFTLDVISKCAFGLQFNQNSPESNKFKSTVEKIFKPSFSHAFSFFTIILLPKLAPIVDARLLMKEVGDYFVSLTKENMKYRKENHIQHNDYFQLLLNLKEQEESGKDFGLSTSDTTEDDAVINQMQYTETNGQPAVSRMKLFTDKVLCANSTIFLVAGSESVASTVNFTLFELSRHPDIQETLQQEVDTVMAKHAEWSYDAVKNMTYLDQVVQEAQRLYPVIPFLMRECMERYQVPDSEVVIEKGMLVGIPVIGLHKDPQYYPDPDVFRPERFVGNNFKPSPTYLPFGDGPRICIAMRFAVMEVKSCIARIMSQYSVRLSPKTQLPIQFDHRSSFAEVKGGIWLSFEKRNDKTT